MGVSSPSRRSSTIVQFIGAQGLVVLAIVQGIVLVPLYLRYIGANLYGQWLALGSTVAMLGLLDLGVTNLVVQRTAMSFSARDYRRLGSLLGTIVLFDVIVIAVIGGTGLAFSPWLSVWIGAYGVEATQLTSAFRAATLDVMLMLLVSMSGSILFGLQRPTAHMAGSFIGTIVSILLTVFLLFKGMGVCAIAYGSLARPVVTLPVNIFALVRILKRDMALRMVIVERAMVRDFFHSALWVGPAKIAETLATQVDNLVVIRILRPLDVTILVLTRKVMDVLVQMVGRLSASFLSGLSHLGGSGDEERYRQVVDRLFLTTAYLGSIGMGGVALLNADFVRLWTTPEMFGGQVLTLLLCVYGGMKILRIMLYNVVFSRGEIRVTSFSSMVEAVIQVVAGILLCRIFGIIGVVLAGVLAVTAGVILQAAALFNIMHIRGTDVLRMFERVIPAVLLPILVGAAIRAFWRPTGWLTISLFAAGFLTISIASIIAREAELRSYIRSRLPVFS